MRARLRTIAFRMYGQPPAKDAPQSERLRYMRRFYTRPLWLKLLTVLLGAYIIVEFHQTWIIVLLAVSALIAIQGYTSLSVRIRRAERREIAAHTEHDHT
jgi:uncharacterized membrane protein YdbT with pleckstrin-like domain